MNTDIKFNFKKFKKNILLNLIVISCLIACKKSKIELSPSNEALQVYIPSDSCSYTIDGITFTCNVESGIYTYVAGTNYSTITNTWAPTDTALYAEGFILSTNSYVYLNTLNRGYLRLDFAKKLVLNKIAPGNSNFQFPSNRFDTSFYKIGLFGYATDYKRLNNKQGVAISVLYSTPILTQQLFTYSLLNANIPTIINDTSQNNSTFEIVKVFKSGGYTFVESKFSANMFSYDEEKKRLTNGYVRFSY